MKTTITHFMWGYQPHFRIGQQSAADRIFQSLDGQFKTNVFLVGILAEEKQDRYPACVEPEDRFWIHSNDFNHVSETANKLLEEYPERSLLHSHPIAQKHHDDAMFRKSIRDAVNQTIQSHASKPVDMTYFVSSPAKVDCYWVFVVLGLQTGILNSHYLLQKSSLQMHEFRHYFVTCSLIDAAVSEYLRLATEELMKPEPGSSMGSTIEAEELLRSAGKRLMTDIVCRIDQNRIVGLHNIFRACNTISSLFYERSVGAGTIILARHDHPSLDMKVKFADPAELGNYRGARKLIQLASHGLSLHSDSEGVYGLATLFEYNEQDEDLFLVKLIDHHHWELLHSNHSIMCVKYGQPYLPKQTFDENKLRNDLPRIFKKINSDEVDRIVGLIKEAEKESHGTMVVITESAAEEAERMKTQGTPVMPFDLTPDILHHLTSIDGAILINPDGTCYSIGTILDGSATGKGDPSRGARYNSAIRYIESSGCPSMAVVISEDGGIDIIPNLRPAIKRIDISQKLSELENLKAAERIDMSSYSKIMDWFENHRFYLLKEDCDALNTLYSELEKRIDAETKRTMWLIRNPFMPNDNLDKSLYYLPEE